MSKKKATDFYLTALSENRPYVQMHFLDKKDRVMMSSVDIVLNVEYIITEEREWDLTKLRGFVRTR